MCEGDSECFPFYVKVCVLLLSFFCCVRAWVLFSGREDGGKELVEVCAIRSLVERCFVLGVKTFISNKDTLFTEVANRDTSA